MPATMRVAIAKILEKTNKQSDCGRATLKNLQSMANITLERLLIYFKTTRQLAMISCNACFLSVKPAMM
jgi:hypothetical protein